MNNMNDNCYCYALNLVGGGSLNPGMVSSSTGIHGGDYETIEFREACEQDGLIYCGNTAPNPLYVSGSYYTVALFGGRGDMHWARVDSQGNWSDKMPRAKPTYSSFQDDGLTPDQITISGSTKWVCALRFIAYYKVDVNQVQLRWMQPKNQPKKKGKCTIL
jgi:hypothetical protein